MGKLENLEFERDDLKERILEIYFASRLARLNCPIAGEIVPDLPGVIKFPPFVAGRFKLLELNWDSDTHRTGLIRVLLDDCLPIWHMHWDGWLYPPSQVFLDQALRRTFEASFFAGGRGPQEFQRGNLLYSNFVQTQNWDGFGGTEAIYEGTCTKGSIWYSGGLLIALD